MRRFHPESGIMGAVKLCPVCSQEFAPGVTNCPTDGVQLVALNTEVGTRPEELIGQVVDGRYRIERLIGKGGMGTVYACRHVVVGKAVAMKVLRPGVERSEGVLQRFVREAQTANMLKSRHIVEMTDFGQLQSGLFYVVMELLEGQDLTRAMKAQNLSYGALIHIFAQVAETLQLAHDKSVVHRDLKPDNVFLVNEDGDPYFVKLLDFGIAKVLHEGTNGLTETGVILGTPYYMSPEQARADLVDHRSDIYALGVMMYRAFTGRLPFVADSTMGVLTRHITEAPEPPSMRVKIDPVLERIILRCMEKDPNQRFQRMAEIAEMLRSLPSSPGAPFRDAPTVNALGDPALLAAASGAYPASHTPQPSGAHRANPTPQPSGAHRVSGAHYTSGAHYAGAAPQPSGAHYASGAHASAAYAGGQADPNASSGPHVPTGASQPWSPGSTGGTAAVLSTTRASAVSPPPSRGALVIGGAVAMVFLGAIAAFLIFGRRPAGDAPGVTPAASVAGAEVRSAPASPTPAAPGASSEGPTTTARDDQGATVVSTGSARADAAPPARTSAALPSQYRGGGVTAPKPAATETSEAPPKRPRTEIRSPFD